VRLSVGLPRWRWRLHVTFFDTAEVYGPFTNEELLGEALREIESAASKITVQGDRYPEHLARMTGL
jgi:aryl-alcohol dehydrogenase-like predicted oxidoreductase